MATTAVIPASSPGTSESHVHVIWRRTDTGWVRAENWLIQRDYLYREPSPPIYPLAVLPLVLMLSVTALVLDQPASPGQEPIRPPQPHH